MPNYPDSSRRNFLKKSHVLGAAVVAGKMTSNAGTVLPPLPANPATEKAMPMRNLGRTGYRVGIFSLGGQASIVRSATGGAAVAVFPPLGVSNRNQYKQVGSDLFGCEVIHNNSAVTLPDRSASSRRDVRLHPDT